MGGIILNCTNCGSDNKADSQFCKKCGANLMENETIISKINSQINLLAVFIGLIISIAILFIGSLLFSVIINSGFNLSIYVGIILLAMAFFGSIITGILTGNDINKGCINGAFLSLFILVVTGIVLGILLFVIMGIASVIASALSPFSSLSSTNTTTSSTSFLYDWINLLEGVGLIVMLFLSGGIGGALGAFIKNALR